MKISQLLETMDFLKFLPEPKLKKVQGFLTPEVAAKHHELICQVLAKFVPGKDLDVIAAHMNDRTASPEDVKFYMGMIFKALKDAKPELRREGAAVVGSIPPIKDEQGRTDFACWYQVTYEKSKWQVHHPKVGWRFGDVTKRFDDPKEVVPYLTSVFKKFEKLRADVKAMKEKNEGK